MNGQILYPLVYVVVAVGGFIFLVSLLQGWLASCARRAAARDEYMRVLEKIRQNPADTELPAAALLAGRGVVGEAAMRNDIDAARGRL